MTPQAPIKNYRHATYPQGSVTQWFDENRVLYSRYGFKGHTGLDIVAPHGEPILAVEGGTVIDAKDDITGFGKHVRVLSDEEYDGAYREWGYGHFSRIDVEVGQKVKAGEQIGLMGNTGFVVSGATPYWEYNPYAGTHLHLQCRMAKRTKKGWSYPGSKIKIDIVNYDNGYKGSFDIAPLFAFKNSRLQKMLTIISLQRTVVGLLERLIAKG